MSNTNKLNDNFAVRVKTRAQSYLQTLPSSVGSVNSRLISDGAGGSRWQIRASSQVLGTVINWLANDNGSFFATRNTSTTYTFSNALDGMEMSFWIKNTGASTIVITFSDVNKVGGYLVGLPAGQDALVKFFKANGLIYATTVDNKSQIPVGTTVPLSTDSIPYGWMLCDGSAISRTVYSDLYAAIGVKHGYGNNSTTFNIPDYRGRFLRGVDGAGRDPDSGSRGAMAAGGNSGNNVGSVQADALQNITGSISNVAGYGGSSGAFTDAVATGLHNDGGGAGRRSYSFNAANVVRTSTETRPVNAYVNFIIKY